MTKKKTFVLALKREALALKIERNPLIIVVFASLFWFLTTRADEHYEIALSAIVGNFAAAALLRSGFNAQLLFYLIFPCLLLSLLRIDARQAGLGLGNIRFGVTAVLLTLIALLPLCGLIASLPSVQLPYAILCRAGTPASYLQARALPLFLLILQSEFFFRGYLMLALRKSFGEFHVLLLQLFPYVLIHAGKSNIEILAAIPGGLLLGYIALRSGSIWYGVILHWLFAYLIEIAVLISCAG